MAVHTTEELHNMTVKDLRELAKELPGVTGIHSMKKDELIALLAKGGEAGEVKAKAASPKKAPKAKAEKKPRTREAVWALLDDLRKEKTNAQAARDKVKIEVLRRRINRLKKQTRKATATPVAPAA